CSGCSTTRAASLIDALIALRLFSRACDGSPGDRFESTDLEAWRHVRDTGRSALFRGARVPEEERRGGRLLRRHHGLRAGRAGRRRVRRAPVGRRDVRQGRRLRYRRGREGRERSLLSCLGRGRRGERGAVGRSRPGQSRPLRCRLDDQAARRGRGPARHAARRRGIPEAHRRGVSETHRRGCRRSFLRSLTTRRNPAPLWRACPVTQSPAPGCAVRPARAACVNGKDRGRIGMVRSKMTLRAAAAAALLLVTACGGGDGSGGAGGTIVVGMRSDFGGFNPITSDALYSMELMNYALFTPLIQYDENLQPRPWLAESWVEEGDTAVVFRLRTDVTWHDGQRVTAEDVKFTFDRARLPESASLIGSAFLSNVESATVIDSFTIRFDYARPHAQALEDFWWAPAPKHLLEGIAPAD